ncbi:MAG: radical SAM superfamily protein [uncultured bacterium]|nr:MAG: radical SAM superfamily protein [uncultured bacterium]
MKYIFKGLKNIINQTGPKARGLTWQSLKNYTWAFMKIPTRVPLPVEIQLEPSALCNLRCKMCTLDKDTKGDKFLSRQNLKKLLNDLGQLKTINFTGMGESLLNKDLEFLIKEAKWSGIETYFITNGQLLSKERANRLIKAGLDKIAISIESADPKIYEKIRGGVSFDKLEKNISDLKRVIKKNNAKIKLGFNVVFLKENINDLDSIFKIIDFAKKFDIDFISFQNVHDAFMNQTISFFKKDKGLLIRNLFEIEKYCGQKEIEVSLPSVEMKPNSCYYPWIYPFITASGELLPCCVIPQFGAYQKIVEKYSFGNVFTDSFAKVWNGSKAAAFRKTLTRKKPDKHCRRCSKYLNIL